MRLTWFGHSAFALTSGKHTVLLDPFLSGNPSATTAAADLNATTILLSHAHGDHMGDTVEIAKRTGAPVIAVAEIATWLGQQGVENTVGANFGGTVQFDGGSTKFVPAWHTSSYGDTFEAPSIPAGHVIRFGGKTIYFAGDTCLFGDMALIGEEGLDVAILPIGDHFTMGPDDAVKAAKLLNAPIIIPCHYNTFPPIEQDPHAFATQVAKHTTSKVQVLEPGGSIEV